MSKTHIAAIDLGATSGRVIVGSYTSERLDLTEVHRFPNTFHTLKGYDYWEVGSFFSHIREGLIKAKSLYGDLLSCGVDTWGVDYCLLNQEGRLVFPVHAYRDERTKALHEGIDEREDAAKIYDWTGIPNINYNTSLQLQETVRNCPAIRELASQCLLLPDYFNYLLSGIPVNEFSIASTTQLLEARGDHFSKEAFDYFEIPESWFQGPAKAGRMLDRVQGIPGLEDVNVALVPGHDTSCAYEAIPRIGNDIFVSAGTWLLVGAITDGPALGEAALRARLANERTGDGLWRPNRQLLGLWLFEQLADSFPEKPSNDAEWDSLIEQAEDLPAASYVIDTTDKRLFNPNDMRAQIETQLRERGESAPDTLAGYLRLICDSLGQSLKLAIADYEAVSGERFDNLIMVGGGSKNRLLCQRTADLAGIPVTSYNLEGTAVGNMGYQLLANGIVSSLDEFRAVVANGLNKRVYQPS